jgi:glycolate oxidase iron-sulfur subunit
MRAMQDGRLPVGDAAVRHIDLCLGCRACEAVCPSGVQYGELLESTREHIETHYERSPFQKFLRRVAIEKVFPFPERMELALRPTPVMKKVQRFLPKFAREALSLVPDTVSSQPVPPFSAATGTKRGTVGLIRGCVMSVMFGDTNASTVALLNRAGYDVVTPDTQVCCGALYAHGGNLKSARECARTNVRAFANVDAIVINAAGCGSTLKEYGHLLGGDAAGKVFSAKVKDITEILSPENIGPTKPEHRKVTYHDACHLAHAQRITRQPRDLVRAVAGKNFVDLPESDVCCGSAGSYNLTEPEMAARLQRRKTENVLKTGAELVITTNPGCMLQIQAGLKKVGRDIQVMHLADYLHEKIV